MIQLENDHFTAKIDPRGAQWASLIKKSTNYEYIWQRDPAFWTDSSPNLFPIVGHLKNGTYQYQQETYQMPKHGIVRHEPFKETINDGDCCRMTYHSNPDSLKKYPFEFTLHIDFILTNHGMKIQYTIENKGADKMPVGLGYHPAFAIDVQNFKHNDYEIVFNKKETLDLYGIVDNLFGLRQKGYLENETSIPLSTNLFDDDALIFTHIQSDEISIRRKSDDWKLTVKTGGAPHLGLWAKSAAPYVCIEPWYVYLDAPDATDDLFDKPGMVALEGGAELIRWYEVVVS